MYICTYVHGESDLNCDINHAILYVTMYEDHVYVSTIHLSLVCMYIQYHSDGSLHSQVCTLLTSEGVGIVLKSHKFCKLMKSYSNFHTLLSISKYFTLDNLSVWSYLQCPI